MDKPVLVSQMVSLEFMCQEHSPSHFLSDSDIKSNFILNVL